MRERRWRYLTSGRGTTPAPSSAGTKKTLLQESTSALSAGFTHARAPHTIAYAKAHITKRKERAAGRKRAECCNGRRLGHVPGRALWPQRGSEKRGSLSVIHLQRRAAHGDQQSVILCCVRALADNMRPAVHITTGPRAREKKLADSLCRCWPPPPPCAGPPS